MALVDAIYIRSLPKLHYNDVKTALLAGRHVLCESPLTLSREETDELFQIALDNNLILMEAIKTAYSTAFRRLLLLIKSGKIGEVVSVDVTCTSIRSECNEWDGVSEWAPTALLPVFEILGVDYKDKKIITFQKDGKNAFAKFDFLYEKAVATIKVGSGVKAEGSLIVSGTEGYIYVPAPWWKTDYFEIRYEDQNKNKRYFYQLDGEGIRYELVAFLKSIETTKDLGNIDHSITSEISAVMQAFEGREYTVL